MGGCIAAGVLLFGAVHQAGYVVSGFWIVKGGSVEIYNALPNSPVFIDNRRLGVTDSTGSFTAHVVRPGTRSVIVSNASAWPWILDVTVLSNELTRTNPLQVPQAAQINPLLSATDPLHISARNELAAYREPTRISPLTRGTTKVWVEGTIVYAQRGEEVHTIAASATPIRSLFWYGDRDDAVIMATQNVVAAFDLRKSSIQNYFPIYNGEAPSAAPDTIRSNQIFVRDADQLMVIRLF